MNTVHCQDLSKSFSGVRAVDHLNLDIPAGAIYGLVGPNGAGKTTAIKTMMNIIQPDAGSAAILGCDSRLLGPKQFARIGYVSENQQMPDWMTIDYLMGYLKPFYPAWDDARADELLRHFDLPRNRKLKHLSRGMWMKASLASSLAYRPALLVLDEPFSGLDPLVRDELIECLLERAPETTIFLSSHDLAEIESFSSHVGYLHQGRLLFSEEMTTLSNRFREVTITLAGPSPLPANLPAAWLEPQTADCVLRFVQSDFSDERSPREMAERFPAARDIGFEPISLRQIFLAIAKSARGAHGGSSHTSTDQEKQA